MNSARPFEESTWPGYQSGNGSAPNPGPWPPRESQAQYQSPVEAPASDEEYYDDDYDDEPPAQELFEEIAALTDGIEQATDLEALKPVYQRLVEFGHQYKRNIHLEPLITQAQQRMVARGTLLKQAAEAGPRIDTATGLAVVTEPDLAAPQADQMLARVFAHGSYSADRPPEIPAEIKFFRHEDNAQQNRPHQHRKSGKPEIKVTPIAREGHVQQKTTSKLLVRTLLGIGMGVSMVFGTFVIMRNQQSSPEPPGPAVNAASPAPAKPASLLLTTDVPNGEVTIDGKPAGGLSEGEWALAELSPGDHVLQLRADACDARFEFSIAAGGPPTWLEPAQASNCTVLAVAAAGKRGSILSNEPGLALQLDEQRIGYTGLKPVVLGTLFPGEHMVALGAPRVEKKLHIFTRETATLSFFVQVSGATGTLVVSVPEDGVELLLNKRSTGKTSRGGRLRLPMLKPGDYIVGATKHGFRVPADQLVTIRRGQEAHVDFALAPVR
ncbi:MAG TPA: carboxypeptidase-like regulatory domain-containing protein [Bryobacteraceae bacterium]|nr:carboxypeptidase-like regulatory domain-containing protein [Bryobacteraceae bacterium]